MEFALTRRASQPQGAVEIDWSNPITRGLVFLHNAADFGTNLVDGAYASFQSGTVGLTSIPSGTGLEFSNGVIEWAVPTMTFPLSMFMHGRAFSAADAPLMGVFGPGPTRSGVYVNNENGLVSAVNANNDGFSTNSTTGFTDSFSDSSICLAVSTAANLNVFYDGVQILDGIRGDVRTDLNRVSFSFINESTRFGRNGSGSHAISGVWDRELEDWEKVSLYENPWQLLKPLAVSSLAGSGVTDIVPPTVTSVSGTDTGSTSATVSASSTEAGPGWCVLTPTSAQPDATQVEAGQDHTGSSTGVFLDTATLAIGANPGAFVFTGLTPGATYWPHVVAKDTASPVNVSAVESGPSFTMPAPDVIDPEFPPGTTLGFTVKTNSTVALTASADATDNVGVAGYEWSSDGGATYPFTSLTRSFEFTALADLTSYNFRCRAYDGATPPNKSAHLALTTSTYRDGDTGQNIRDNTGPVGGNPEGFLRNKVTLPADAAKWFSYVITSMPATGSFTTLNPDGTFVFVGPNNETMLVQLEVDGANYGSPFAVTLYDSTSQLATPSNAISTTLSTRSAAIQDFNATPVNATSIGTATLSVATPPTAVSVQPVNSIIVSYASRSSSRTLSLARAAKRARLPASGQTRRYLALFYKQPADFDDCDVDATDYLFAIGDTLVACEVDVEPGITIEANTVVGSTVKIWLSGGVDGRRYKVTARLITAGGRTKEVELVIRVKET